MAESADRLWRKSTASQPNGNCVEVGTGSGSVQVRDSRNRSGAVLTFTPDGWQAFLAVAGSGQFHLPDGG